MTTSYDSESRSAVQRIATVFAEAGEIAVVLERDARRLFAIAQRLVDMDLVPPPVDLEALELAAWSWHLPLAGAPPGSRRTGHMGFRERADQSAELLLGALPDSAAAERAAGILREVPRRATAVNEARILSDAINLEDFGISGVLQAAMRMARRNMALDEVLEALTRRREYGYWEALLKDGFHFEPVRQMARRRLEAAWRVLDALAAELRGQA